MNPSQKRGRERCDYKRMQIALSKVTRLPFNGISVETTHTQLQRRSGYPLQGESGNQDHDVTRFLHDREDCHETAAFSSDHFCSVLCRFSARDAAGPVNAATLQNGTGRGDRKFPARTLIGCDAGPAGRLFLPKRLPIHNPIHPTEDHHETIAFSSDYFCSCFCCVYLSGVEGPPSPAFRNPPEPEQPDPTLEARTFVLAFLFFAACAGRISRR